MRGLRSPASLLRMKRYVRRSIGSAEAFARLMRAAMYERSHLAEDATTTRCVVMVSACASCARVMRRCAFGFERTAAA